MFKATRYYLQIYLKTVNNSCLFLIITRISMAGMSKKKNVKLELLTDYDMLLMVEEGIRGEICHAIHRHAKANNKYMKNYDKNKESSYIHYLDANSYMVGQCFKNYL